MCRCEMPDVNKLSLWARRKSGVPPGCRRGLRQGIGRERRWRGAAPAAAAVLGVGAAHTRRPLSWAQHRSPTHRSRNKFRSLFSAPLSQLPWLKPPPENETRPRHPVAARGLGPPRPPRRQPARAGTSATGGAGQGPPVRGGVGRGLPSPASPAEGGGKRGRLRPAAAGKVVPRKKKKKPFADGSPPPPSPSPPQLSPTRRAGK